MDSRPARSGIRWDLAAAAIFLVVALVFCWGALWSGFQIGDDEHYEVTKAFLWSKGFSLYYDIWNDQQPLLTVLQGLLFKGIGVHAGTARGLALVFGALLVAGLFHLVRKCSGVPAAFVAMAGLLAAPHVFKLSLSPMTELPAFAVGLWALWAIRRWDRDGHGVWLVVSGLALAVALEIKLTAVLLAPALAVELAVLTLARPKPRKGVEIVRNLLVFGGSALGGLVLMGLLLGADYGQAYGSHFAAVGPSALAEIRKYAFTPADLLRYRQALLALAASLGLAAWRGHLKRIAFPLVLFATALAVHLLYRPFWPFYYLHFALPVAWLTGYVAGELWKSAASLRRPAWITAASLLSAAVVVYAGLQLGPEIKAIRSERRIESDRIVAAMKAAAPQTRWVYTRSTMYAFHARLPVIPELAVMPKKRFWTGQITPPEIAAVVRRYRPEQLLLDDRDMADEDMARLVREDYTLACSEAGLSLWLRVDRRSRLLFPGDFPSRPDDEHQRIRLGVRAAKAEGIEPPVVPDLEIEELAADLEFEPGADDEAEDHAFEGGLERASVAGGPRRVQQDVHGRPQ